MKPSKIFGFLLIGMFLSSFVSALSIAEPRVMAVPTPTVEDGSPDTQLIDAYNQKQKEEREKQTKELNQNFKFQTISSCDGMEKVLGDFLEMYKKLYPKERYYYGYGVDDMVVMEDSKSSEQALAPTSDMSHVARDSADDEAVAGGDGDYSTTNIQVKGVDEPEILKTDGTYLYYYNSEQQNVQILKAPTNGNVNEAKVLKTINLPESFYGVQMFVQNGKLVILATSYDTNRSYQGPLGSDKTTVVVYDVSKLPNLKLERFFDVNGSLVESRVLDGELYVVSKSYLDWYRLAYDYDTLPINELLPQKREVLVVGSKKQTGNTLSDTPKTISCEDILYLLPTEESLKQYRVTPSVATISKIGLANPRQATETKVLFGDVDNIHMSQKSLYVTNNFYTSYPFTCGRCFWPGSYQAGQNTLIHKFNLGNNLNYQTSTIIPGTPLSQYSMDEDSEGYFRILTKTWNPNLATHLFILDPKLQLYSSLQDIEPGEEFKSSRYIGDKLYLVTFQQIDPLFVVDLANKKSPKIVGELKIPGYSTYLHPYASASNGVQYLIGLGYNTKTNDWGGLSNDGVKVDLYKVDYTKFETVESKCKALAVKGVDTKNTSLCLSSTKACSNDQLVYEKCVSSVNPENIWVEQLSSLVFDGDMVQSDAVHNPRMFVWDQKRKLLLLPVQSYTMEKVQNCSAWGGKKECWDSVDYKPFFNGIKGVTIDPTRAMSETVSKNYMDQTPSDTQYWNNSLVNPRVGYIGDSVYFFNTKFADFFVPGKEGAKMVKF